jgi:hypothetical protein
MGLEVFTNYQTVLYALGVFMITYVIRLGVQVAWKNWKTNKVYNEFVLHVLPIVTGGVIAAFAKKFPWPAQIAGSLSARMFYGMIMGMFCGFVYGRVRKFFETSGAQNFVPVPEPTPEPTVVVVPDDDEAKTNPKSSVVETKEVEKA